MAYRVIFWRPRSGVNVWLPADRPLGDVIRSELLAGRTSEHLDRFPTQEMFQRLRNVFPGAHTDEKGSLHWSDDIDNGFVANHGEQFVEVCAFDLADEELERVFAVAEEFACEHYDLGN
jgi:hypothetical protein